MTDRKALAKSLDRAAANCLSYPATSKQCWFLSGLMAQAGEDMTELFGDVCPTQYRLSSKMASNFIDMYLRDQKKAA
jgi:hypothetical protein